MENFSSFLIERKVFRSLQTIGRQHIICLAFVCSVGLHALWFFWIKSMSNKPSVWPYCNFLSVYHFKALQNNDIFSQQSAMVLNLIIMAYCQDRFLARSTTEPEVSRAEYQKGNSTINSHSIYFFFFWNCVILSNLSLWPSLCFFVLSFLVTVHPVWLHFYTQMKHRLEYFLL